MKTHYFISGLTAAMLISFYPVIYGQWASSGNNIYTTNSGNTGIGTNSPLSLLYVVKTSTEPTITISNSGGTGGATYAMIDDASGAAWKFKATLSGGFKIRDHSAGNDVITIEPNSDANRICIKNSGNIGMGTASPVLSALLHLEATNKGLLLPRLTQTEVNAISGPANSLMLFNTSSGKISAYFASAGIWKNIVYGSGTISVFTCGNTLTINHVAGLVAPVTKTVNYGTVLTSLSGNSCCWITQNLGSDRQALAVNDATEQSAGWYWQFNRQQGYKHDGTIRTPNTTWINPITEHAEWMTVNDPCSIELGVNWRIPTYSEWRNVIFNGGWTDWNTSWNSVLKMHASGNLNELTGNLTWRGVYGDYWSGSQGNDSDGGLLELGNGINATLFSYSKANGFTVRCIEAPAVPAFSCGTGLLINHVAGNVSPVTKTVLYGTVSGVPGETAKCWITSNLGADQQATAVSDATEASAGWYWQFNRQQGYMHDGSAVTPAWTITGIMENFDWDAANDPCVIELGFGWHIPTSTEWTNTDAAGGWTDWNGPWNSLLKMHAAGYLNPSNGVLYERGTHGYYWSRNQNPNQTFDGLPLYFFSTYCDTGVSLNKASGQSVRCVR
ncbi:MAG: hypothetical protein KA096_02125 [Bacteroidales bacterium]|nr:hypothetical protein [Bacteroidales bacterium]